MLPINLYNYLHDNLSNLLCKYDQKKLVILDNSAPQWVDIVLNAKRILFNFKCILINNFLPFFLYSSTFNEKQIIANEIFAFKDYI